MFESQGQKKAARQSSNITVQTVITISNSFVQLNYNNSAFNWF
jgi:hypothetical protein